MGRLLSPAGKTLSQRSPETMVVLFGPTQVGKTTLLLTLLGIADGPSFDAVQKVLRGNRQHGASSTATPMRYTRSPDNLWRWDRPDGTGLSADEMQAELANIRWQVENGSWQGTDPVSLYIPACHFTESDPPVRVAILDLPGIAAANPRERELVERIAERYIPAASLILLVSTANRLGVFEPEKLGQELEELKGWVCSPIRYRLVITYAYSQDSVRRWCEDNDATDSACDLAALRAFFKREIDHFELKMPDDLPARIYPLELGDSWAGMKQKDDKYHHWSAQVQAAALQALTVDIRQSCEGERRLRISKEVREQAYWRQEDMWRQWRQNRDASRKAARQCQEEIRAKAASKNLWKKHFLRYDDRLRRLDKAESLVAGNVRRWVRDANVASQTVSPSPGISQEQLLKDHKPIQATVSALQEWLAADQKKLVTACDRITDWFNKETGLQTGQLEPPPCAQVADARKHLKAYSMDAYWTWITNQFEADSTALAQAAVAHRKALQDHLQKQLLKRLQDARNTPSARRRLAAQQRDQCDANIKKLIAQDAHIREKWKQCWERHQARLKAVRHDLEKVSQFETHMANAHDSETQRLIGLVHDAVRVRNPALALARLCQMRLSRAIHRKYCTGIE
jgi:energy-coupling factor transporter ATP-binding protein EcfA2